MHACLMYNILQQLLTYHPVHDIRKLVQDIAETRVVCDDDIAVHTLNARESVNADQAGVAGDLEEIQVAQPLEARDSLQGLRGSDETR